MDIKYVIKDARAYDYGRDPDSYPTLEINNSHESICKDKVTLKFGDVEFVANPNELIEAVKGCARVNR
jgi:hypothetical protein